MIHVVDTRGGITSMINSPANIHQCSMHVVGPYVPSAAKMARKQHKLARIIGTTSRFSSFPNNQKIAWHGIGFIAEVAKKYLEWEASYMSYLHMSPPRRLSL